MSDAVSWPDTFVRKKEPELLKKNVERKPRVGLKLCPSGGSRDRAPDRRSRGFTPQLIMLIASVYFET
jgi:hypothetical protein